MIDQRVETRARVVSDEFELKSMQGGMERAQVGDARRTRWGEGLGLVYVVVCLEDG